MRASSDALEALARRPWLAPSTIVAVAIALGWLAFQLGPYLGEAPDLDAMVSLREAIVFHREGLDGLIADRVGTGVHPPLADVLSALAFAVFGEDPRSQQLLAIPLFAVLAAATERLLAPWLPSRQRIAAAFAVAICPALGIVIALVAREGIVLPVLATALAIALAPPAMHDRRLVLLGAVLALLPLTKETTLVLIPPFVLLGAYDGDTLSERVRRAVLVAALPAVAMLGWRLVLDLEGGGAWQSWIFSPQASAGPYVVALRAMLGLEDLLYLRQNLANAFIVNWLWVPSGLAVATLGLVLVRPAAPSHQRAILFLASLAVVAAWTTLAFPTYTVPRYATPIILCTTLIALIGAPLWPQRWQAGVLGVVIVAFVLGAWSPTDPVSRTIWGTTSVGGERFYDTTERQRGPDRVVFNFAVLRASERMNARLRHVFASDVTLVTGDCNALKFGEKLFSVGFQPSVFDRTIPRARPLSCVPISELPPGAAEGPDRIGLVRTTEDAAAKRPLAVSGPAIVVIH